MKEQEILNTLFCRWKEDFTIDVVSFACEVTEINAGKHSLLYTDKLLQVWKHKEIKTKEEAIKYCEEERKKFFNHRKNR